MVPPEPDILARISLKNSFFNQSPAQEKRGRAEAPSCFSFVLGERANNRLVENPTASVLFLALLFLAGKSAMLDHCPPSSGRRRILTCQAGDVQVGDGKTLALCPCKDRWSVEVTLCGTDATQSRLGARTILCTAHGDEYNERLKSFQVTDDDYPTLASGAITSDETRPRAAQLRDPNNRTLDEARGAHTIAKPDEEAEIETVDRFGVLIKGGDSYYEGNPDPDPRPISATAKHLLTARRPIVVRIVLGGVGYLLKAHPSYAALREDGDPPEILFSSEGHNLFITLSETAFNSAAGQHVPSSICLVDPGELSDTVSYHTLTSEDGTPAPDRAVEHLCKDPLVP